MKFIETLTIEQKSSIFKQVYQTMNDLHCINYVHGDLRILNNIMYNPSLDIVKLIDFGFCKNLSGTDKNTAVKYLRLDYKHLWALKAALGVQDV